MISGREEPRLIYAGVAAMQPSPQRRLVVDIGGRSTEMILGEGRKPLVAESFAAGCVSLSMRFFEGGNITREGFRQAQVAAGAELEEALQPFAPQNWTQALGSSGTAGAVSDVYKRQAWSRSAPEHESLMPASLLMLGASLLFAVMGVCVKFASADYSACLLYTSRCV